MSDDQIRGRVRAATATRDPREWLHAATALARAGRHDEAAHALLRARSLGAERGTIQPVRAQIAPNDITSFHVRGLFEGEDPSGETLGGWSADGRHLYLAGQGGTISVADVSGGARRQVATLVECRVYALGADLDGARLTLAGTFAGDRKTAIRILDLKSGALGPPIGRGHRRVRGVTFIDGTGLVGCTETRRARAFSVASTDGRLTWSRSSEGAAMDREGSVALDDGRDVATYALPEKSPRARIPVAGRRPTRSPYTVHVSGDTVLVLRVIGGSPVVTSVSGQEPVTVGLPPGPGDVMDLALESSGRYVGVTWHDKRPLSKLDLVDLRSPGLTRTLELPGRPTALVWSPSGRRLAVGLERSGVAIVEAT